MNFPLTTFTLIGIGVLITIFSIMKLDNPYTGRSWIGIILGFVLLILGIGVFGTSSYFERQQTFETQYYTVIADGKLYPKMRLHLIENSCATLFSVDGKRHIFKNYTIIED